MIQQKRGDAKHNLLVFPTIGRFGSAKQFWALVRKSWQLVLKVVKFDVKKLDVELQIFFRKSVMSQTRECTREGNAAKV